MGYLLEIVGAPQQRFFDTWGLWVVVVGCASMVTSCDLQNAAVSFQAELQSSWCHLWNLCRSDSGFTSALCHGNMQLRTVGSAHFCAPPALEMLIPEPNFCILLSIVSFISCQVLTYNLNRGIGSDSWQTVRVLRLAMLVARQRRMFCEDKSLFFKVFMILPDTFAR